MELTESTPGGRVTSWVQSRPFKGNCTTAVSLTTPPIIEEANCTAGASPLTSTLSLSCPTFMVMLSTCCAPTVRVMPERTSLENPVTAAVTTYSPGNKLGEE